MNQNEKDIEVLKEFLSCDMQNADEVFKIFQQIKGSETHKGKNHGERFLFKQGTRKDRMTLIAHADTFYDKDGIAFSRTPIGISAEGAYIYPDKYPDNMKQEIVQEGSILRGANPDVGIGADDRAGCAILWLMRNSGHNILLFDGEESVYQGAKYLMRDHKKIHDEIQNSHFAIEFDFPWKNELSYHGTPAPETFKNYIEQKTGYKNNPHTPPTDIGVLCRNMCAVNLSVGYYNPHTKNEYLDMNVWLKTLEATRQISDEKIPQFDLSPKKGKFQLPAFLTQFSSRLKSQKEE